MAMADAVKIKGKSFGQKQPPLSVIINGILDKYPDGQIFKVCKKIICILHIAFQSRTRTALLESMASSV